MSWREQDEKPEAIHGDRRYDRRYSIALELRWRLVRRRKVLESGTGTTVDLSSGGVLFEAGRALPVGLNVELSIAWPALLHDVSPLQLVVAGRIVRTHGSRTAIQMTQHEFRTAGTLMEQRKSAAGTMSRPSYFSPVTAIGKVQRLH